MWCDAEVLLDALGGISKGPAGLAHEEVHAVAGTAGLMLSTALITKPCAVAIEIIEAVAIFTTAERAGLMFIGELLSAQTC